MTTINNPLEEFINNLKEANFSNIEFGFIENNLFGSDLCPSDENNVNNAKIKIFYFLKKANRENAPYIVFLNGGPGIAASVMFFEYHYEQFLPDYNIVFFDQRGNGLSHSPSGNVYELKYYSAKYISSDAEKIREVLIGKEEKWIVFGQSYGGVVARKYIEYAPQYIQRVLTHGSAKFDPIEDAINTELNTRKRLDAFFQKYPEDLLLIEKLKLELLDNDSISSAVFRLQGTGLVHILAILYSVKTDEDFHAFLGKLDANNIKESYLNFIRPLSNLLLNAGLVNQAVAQIDLIGDYLGDELLNRSIETLKLKGIDVYQSTLSKTLFDKSLVSISKDFDQLEILFKEKIFETDTVDLEALVKQTTQFNFELHSFGGEADSLAINAIKKEEAFMKEFKAPLVFYHYSHGHHREWLENDQMFRSYL